MNTDVVWLFDLTAAERTICILNGSDDRRQRNEVSDFVLCQQQRLQTSLLQAHISLANGIAKASIAITGKHKMLNRSKRRNEWPK